MSGLRGHLGGIAAEEAVERHYAARGGTVLARRWRSAAGEIDLIIDDGGTAVFVEVKARQDHRTAAEAITPRQWRRVAASAEVFMSEAGRMGGDMRFDAALVNGQGAVEVIENVTVWE